MTDKNLKPMPDVIYAGKDDDAEITFWYQTQINGDTTIKYIRAQEPTGEAVEALKKPWPPLNAGRGDGDHYSEGWNDCLDEIVKRGLLQTPAAGNADVLGYRTAREVHAEVVAEEKEIDLSGLMLGTHVIVPIEPTEAMIKAAWKAQYLHVGGDDDTAEALSERRSKDINQNQQDVFAYKAMIAAANTATEMQKILEGKKDE